MSAIRRAVIDVGTNSVKLFVADVLGRDIQPVWEESKQTRLGQGFYETHQLLPEAIANTAQAVAVFVAQAQSYQTRQIRVIATSAARDAKNAAELCHAVKHRSGQPLEIISGEQEADWAFQGVTTDPALANLPLLLLDVGGGSAEFILGQGSVKYFRESFRLGTVRLLETLPPGDPPTPAEFAAMRRKVGDFIETQIRPALAPLLTPLQQAQKTQPLTLVGTGGTTTILARMEAGLETYDRAVIEATRLSRARLTWHTENLWRKSLAGRQTIVGLPRKRADVILPGVVIFEAVLERFGFPELRVSTRGLRFAAVMEAAA